MRFFASRVLVRPAASTCLDFRTSIERFLGISEKCRRAIPCTMQRACPQRKVCRYPSGMGKRAVAWAVGIIAIGAIALVAYGFHAAGQKRTQQHQVISMLQDSTDKLREALTTKASPDLVAALDANLSAARAA